MDNSPAPKRSVRYAWFCAPAYTTTKKTGYGLRTSSGSLAKFAAIRRAPTSYFLRAVGLKFPALSG